MSSGRRNQPTPHRKLRRNTPQRKVLLEELRKVSSHPTAAELYELVRRRMPKISLGTVYRNLELLTESGTIQKLATGRAEARFDGDPGRHYHVRCVRCGRVDDVHDLPEDLLDSEPKELAGYEILGHRLEFLGICPECGDRRTTDDSRAPGRRPGMV